MKKYLIVARELMVVERTPRTPGFAVRARSRSRCLLNALNLRLDLLHSLAASSASRQTRFIPVGAGLLPLL